MRGLWSALILDLVKQRDNFRSLNFVDWSLAKFWIDEPCENRQPLIRGSELAALKGRIAFRVALHAPFAGQVLLTDGLQRSGGGSSCLSALLASLLDRIGPLLNITGQLLGLFVCLAQGQAGIAPVDSYCPRFPSAAVFILVAVLVHKTAGAVLGDHQAERRHGGVPVNDAVALGRQRSIPDKSGRQLFAHSPI